MGCIERRQARIRRIRQKLNKKTKPHEQLEHEEDPKSWTSAYHIGKTQNHPVDLEIFVKENCHDPAAKVMFKHLVVSHFAT